MKTARFLLLVLVLVSAGCASGIKPKIQGVDWTQRVGTYTYQQAVADLGQPAAIGESSRGKTAEWIVSRRPRMSFGLGVGGGSWGHHSGGGVGVGTSVSPPPRGEYLQLQFDGRDKLSGWRTVKY